MTKVMIADDHTFLRAGVELLLTRSGMDVVASVGDGNEALEAIADTDPDVILLDIRMPGLGGVETIRRLRESGDRRGVVVLATEMDDKELLSLVQCHVDSILFKSCADTELVATIQEVAAGKSIFDRTLLQRARDLAGERHVSTASANLSPREREILELIRQGMTNDEIAERLGIKVGSTKIHVHNILAKTGAKSRRELN